MITQTWKSLSATSPLLAAGRSAGKPQGAALLPITFVSSLRLLAATVAITLWAAPVGVAATFTTVDISSDVNSNIAFNPQTIPVGTTTGNQNTGIPFQIATYNREEGTWNPLFSAVPALDVSVSIPGQASFYALLNNYFGTPGADEYDITIRATNGDSITYQSIGGVDTRDYNANVYTNTVANTTVPWYNNGLGQRLDLREFNLPSSFARETISDFSITQRLPSDPALFTGLTFSTEPVGTPEPVSAALIGIGLAGLAVFRLRCRP